MRSVILLSLGLFAFFACDSGFHPLSKANLTEGHDILQIKQENTTTVESDFNSLQIDFNADDNSQRVTGNLGLPQSGSFGSEISWTSDNHSVVDPQTGIVSRPQKNTVVKLSALIKKGAAYKLKIFSLVVLKRQYTDDDDD